MTARRLTVVLVIFIIAFTIISSRESSSAATLCVDPGGGGGCFTTIQAAINAAMPGDIINVAAGTYTENIILNKSVTLNGAQAGVNACGRTATESIIVPANPAVRTLELQTGCAGAIINGFTFSGGTRAIESASGPLNNLQLVNNRIIGFTGNGIFLNDTGSDITVHQNFIDGASKTGGGGLFHLDTDAFHGFRFTNNCVVGKGATDTSTGFFVDGNHNVSTSATPRKPVISGNSINNCQTGMNLGTRAFGSLTVPNTGTISKNTFSNNLFDGLQGGIQNTLISGNLFSGNGRSGLALTSFGNLGTDRGGQNCTISCNTFTGNGFTQNSGDTAGGGLTFSNTQAVGTIATNRANNNNISGNFAGFRYNGTEMINAENNWWGSATGPTVASNPGGTGDRIVGAGAATTDFVAFQTAVIPDTDGDGLLDLCEPACATVPANLISWWPGNGSAADNQGTNPGMTVNGATFAAGKVGQAFSFDGVDDRVDVPSSASLNLTGTQLTLDGWINPRSNISGTIYFGRSQNSDHPYMIFFATGGIRIVLRAGGMQPEYNTAYIPALNTWTHIAMVYDGATMKLYANGLQVFSGVATGNLDSSPLPFAIGNRTTDPLTSFDGLIDDVEVFDRALTQGEIQALVDADDAGKCDCSGITCPANITQGNDANQCGAVVTYPAPTPNGTTCGTITCSPASGSFFPVGTTTVSCAATTKGASCSFTVTVQDTQPPSVTCPANITVSNTSGQCGAVANFSLTLSDNCPNPTASCSPVSGSFFPVGTTTVTCTASDKSPNSADSTCTFTVTVNDTQPPSLTCPTNLVVVTPPACPASTVTTVTYTTPSATDNCPGVTVACLPPSGSAFPVGTTTITCTATDASGNTATCSFAVKVFNVCVQDRSNPAAVLAWNTSTGDYVFCCNGTTFTGIGQVKRTGCTYTLTHTPVDRRITGKVDFSTFRGEGSLQSPVGTSRCTISDNDVRNNDCSCIGGAAPPPPPKK